MAKLSELRWLVFLDEDVKFPYRLYIEEEADRFLSLKTQEKWPGVGKRIFCKKEGYFSKKDLPQEQPLEECRIISCSRYGRKLTVILDRKIKKRCWFSFPDIQFIFCENRKLANEWIYRWFRRINLEEGGVGEKE